MTTKRISVLGCGWLGLPLAISLKGRGFLIKGSTTSVDRMKVLKESGIEPYQLQAEPELKGNDLKDFFNTDILVLTIPFKRSLVNPEYYLQQIKSVSASVMDSPISFVVFTSSTVVYPETNQTFKEDDIFLPESERAEVLLRTEEFLLKNFYFDTTVVRFGGLYGGDREIGRFMEGKKNLRNPKSPVNLIHLDDCIGILEQIIIQDVRKEILNACSDDHPTRKELYTRASKKLLVAPPVFNEEIAFKFKVISNEKLKKKLNYQFKHPSPLE